MITQLLKYVVRPSNKLSLAVSSALADSGLGAALASGEPIVGIHIRQVLITGTDDRY